MQTVCLFVVVVVVVFVCCLFVCVCECVCVCVCVFWHSDGGQLGWFVTRPRPKAGGRVLKWAPFVFRIIFWGRLPILR